ncbi:MAG TPA: DUF6079 family protein [Pyrinomonadaceae bacterium]|nr:DUF6079 family protein [Pyrinomonadaceae bacterium]
MKRIQEKIKDLVEARTYDAVKNYLSDVELTVSAYRFTDSTSDLLAKWLDEIAGLAHGNSRGAAHALAGNRGAGKSHLLAVLAAITEQPELRSRIGDSHVAASAQSLPRRPLKVVRVMRGTSSTLAEELNIALAAAFDEPNPNFAGSPAQILMVAGKRIDASPLVVVVDSSQARQARVKRDDGALLGEMAEAAKQADVFLVTALDDDISTADGVNAAIARTFYINFLDQEHLYRILDSHIFPKKAPARPILRELYNMMRTAMPGFNWSEPRFSALYPVHPIVADVTPAVRLYAQNFAFLPFAAESGRMTLNRPAHSLIALDEIFDRAEPDLRKSEELADAFAVYDDLATNAIGQIPVMQRLQAKLVLKALFVLSLDGRGACASEIAAAMLIYDESQPEAAVAKVEQMLSTFAAASSGALRARKDGTEIRYCLAISASANFETKLVELAASIQPEAINQILRGAGAARFADWVFNEEAENSTDFAVKWRGTPRRGRVIWEQAETDNERNENLDWEIFIKFDPAILESGSAPRLVWRVASLKPDEEQTLRRYAALQRGGELEEEFGEAVSVAKQTYAAFVERIWTRIFLDEAEFWLGAEKLAVSIETQAAKTLENFLEAQLGTVFDRKFPQHPDFSEMLGASEVSALVSDLFGVNEVNTPYIQKMAENFALPLGLISERSGRFVLESDERLIRQPLIGRIWQAVEAAGEEVVPVSKIVELFKAEPYGLSREAQHLVLAALVARRRLEFVMRTGERIGRRVLDLKIIWTDVEGVVRSSVLPRSNAELINWARSLTNAEIAAEMLDVPEDAENLRAALRSWLSGWKNERILKRFDELPDDILNVRAWRLAAYIGRTFGAAADAVEAITDEQVTLEEGLERIAEAFNDKFEEISAGSLEVEALKNFILSAQNRETIWRYIALAEATDDEQIESLRGEVLEILKTSASIFDSETNDRLNSLQDEFRDRFAAFYVARHDSIVHSIQRPQMLEKLLASPEWSEFVELGALPVFHQKCSEQAADLRRRAEKLKCSFDVRQILREKPFCACGFRLAQASELEHLPHELRQTMVEGRKNYRKTLAQFSPLLAPLLELSSKNNSETAPVAARLAEIMQRNEELPVLSVNEIKVLAEAIKQLKTSALQIRTPRAVAPVSREELRAKLNHWIDNLPAAPFLVKLTDGDN